MKGIPSASQNSPVNTSGQVNPPPKSDGDDSSMDINTQGQKQVKPQKTPQLQSQTQQQPAQLAPSSQPVGQLGLSPSFGGAYGGGYGGSIGGFGADPYGGSFGGYGGTGATGAANRQDRSEMIKKLYKEVLGREAQVRDINYYKYGTQTEDQIRTQLIKGEEHKSIVKNGQKYNKVFKELEETKSRLLSTEKRIEDARQEVEALKQFLDQKNAEITKLRASNQSLSASIATTPIRPSYQPDQSGLIRTNGKSSGLDANKSLPTYNPEQDPISTNYSPPTNPRVLPAESQPFSAQPKGSDLIDRITSIFF